MRRKMQKMMKMRNKRNGRKRMKTMSLSHTRRCYFCIKSGSKRGC